MYLFSLSKPVIEILQRKVRFNLYFIFNTHLTRDEDHLKKYIRIMKSYILTISPIFLITISLLLTKYLIIDLVY